MENKQKRLFGGVLEIIIDESETAGQFDLLKNELQAGYEVPLHLHTRYSETFYLTEGKLTVFIPEKTIVLSAGDHIVIPIQTPHAIRNDEAVSAKGFVVSSPSGFARLVRIAGVPADSNEEVNMDIFKKVSTELGDVLLGPPGTRP